MREVKIGEKTVSVRGLRRGEIKRIRKESGAVLLAPDAKTFEEGRDLACRILFDDETMSAIDALEEHDKQLADLWEAIISETYGSGVEEKNS